MQRLVKLNTNESPYGPSPKAIAAIEAQNNSDLRLYPDPEGAVLKQAIATLHGLSPNQVFLGNGSDEVLAHVFAGLLKANQFIFLTLLIVFIRFTANYLGLNTKLYR